MYKKMPHTAPYGYVKQDGALAWEKTEAVICQLMFVAFAETQRLKTTATYLNNFGFRTRQKALFSDTALQRILTNTTVLGTDIAPPLIEQSLFYQVQQILNTPETSQAKNRLSVHLFSSLTFCSYCNVKMRVMSSTPDKYTCPECRLKVYASDLEAAYLSELSPYIDSLHKHFSEQQPHGVPTQKILGALLNTQKQAHLQHQKHLNNHHQQKAEKTQTQLKQLAKAIKQLQKPKSKISKKAFWKSLSKQQKHQLVRTLTNRITVAQRGIEIIFYSLRALEKNGGHSATVQKPKVRIPKVPPRSAPSKHDEKIPKKQKRVPVVEKAVERLFGKHTASDCLIIGNGEVRQIFETCKQQEQNKPAQQKLFSISFSTFLRTQGYWSYIKQQLPFAVEQIPPRKRKEVKK